MWAIIISVLHRIPACVCSLPTLCPPVIFCTRCPCSNHCLVFLSQCAVSWADLVSVCRDWVSRWAKVEPPSRASRNRGGVWAGVLRRGVVWLEALKVVEKRGRLARRRGGGLCIGRGWYSVSPPRDESCWWPPSFALDWPWRSNTEIKEMLQFGVWGILFSH